MNKVTGCPFCWWSRQDRREGALRRHAGVGEEGNGLHISRVKRGQGANKMRREFER